MKVIRGRNGVEPNEMYLETAKFPQIPAGLIEMLVMNGYDVAVHMDDESGWVITYDHSDDELAKTFLCWVDADYVEYAYDAINDVIDEEKLQEAHNTMRDAYGDGGWAKATGDYYTGNRYGN